MKTLVLLFVTAIFIGASANIAEAQRDLAGIQYYLFSDELQLSEDQKQEISEILKDQSDKKRGRIHKHRSERHRSHHIHDHKRRHHSLQAGSRFWSGISYEVLLVLDEEQRDKLEELIERRQIERRKMRGYMMQSRIEAMGSELGFSDEQVSELKEMYFKRIKETDTDRRNRGQRRQAVPDDP